MLNISAYDLQIYGLVSREIAIAMAEKSLQKSNCQISLAATGVDESASLKGEKGITWISCAGVDKKTITKKIYVRGNREKFCEEVIEESLRLLLKFL